MRDNIQAMRSNNTRENTALQETIEKLTQEQLLWEERITQAKRAIVR